MASSLILVRVFGMKYSHLHPMGSLIGKATDFNDRQGILEEMMKTKMKKRTMPKGALSKKTKAARPIAKVKKPMAKTKKPVSKIKQKPAAKVVASKQKKVAAKQKVQSVKITKPTKATPVKNKARQIVKAIAKVMPMKTDKVKQEAPKPVQLHSKIISPNPASSPLKAKTVMQKPANTDIREAKETFRKGDFVVYPVHGVGKVLGVEKQDISGHQIDVVAIYFEKDRMTLRVPVLRAHGSGLRKLSSRKVMDSAFQTLKGRSRVKRTMWSRRAQEYEAKINSGDPVSIAEVVRDLHRNADQPDQSYSERQIYQAALERLVREVAAIEGITEIAATERLHQVLKAA